MAETPIGPSAKPTPRAQPRLKLMDALADAAIAGLRRYLPKNFGVDLDAAGRARSVAGGRKKAKLKAFARELLSTRLDRSGARVRTIALGLFVAYAGLGVKLLVLGLSHDPPQTLKTAADDAVSGAQARPARPQRRHPRHRRQDHVGVRRAEPDHRHRRGGRAHHRRASRRRREGAARAAELEEGLHLGQTARSRRRSRRRSFISACPASASCRRTSASIPTARSARM